MLPEEAARLHSDSKHSVVLAGAQPAEGAPWSAPRTAPAPLRPPSPPSKKLFFRLERLRVAMKTDFPRGPTLPLRGIGLEKPKWPESRDKKGPLSGGLELESRGRYIPSAPTHTLRAPSPVSPWPDAGRGKLTAPTHTNHLRASQPPERYAVPKPVSCATVPDSAHSTWRGADSRKSFSEQHPEAPRLRYECPSPPGCWRCPVSERWQQKQLEDLAQTAERFAWWPWDRASVSPERTKLKLCSKTPWAPLCPFPPILRNASPPPSITSQSFVLSNFLRP